MIVSGFLASAFFYLLSDQINAYLDIRLGTHHDLIPYVILIGISMSINLITSAYLISYLNLRYLVFASVVYAVVYFFGTALTIIKDLGVVGICISQIIALLMMLITHLCIIYKKIFFK